MYHSEGFVLPRSGSKRLKPCARACHASPVGKFLVSASMSWMQAVRNAEYALQPNEVMESRLNTMKYVTRPTRNDATINGVRVADSSMLGTAHSVLETVVRRAREQCGGRDQLLKTYRAER